jgi:hypothetical protein
MYVDGNTNDREQIIADLYGAADPELKDIFDQRLGVNAPQEAVIYGQEKIYAGEQPASVMRETRLKQLESNIYHLRERLRVIKESLDYLPENRTRKK